MKGWKRKPCGCVAARLPRLLCLFDSNGIIKPDTRPIDPRDNFERAWKAVQIARRALGSNPATCPSCGHDAHTPRYCVMHDCACGEPGDSPWRWTDAEGRKWKAVPDSDPAMRQEDDDV